MDTIKITEDKKEMVGIGREIVNERRDIYTPLMLDKIMERIIQEIPDASDEARNEILYCSVYDFWVYGNNIDEEFYHKFYKKGHQEKMSYLVNRIHGVYIDYLNCGDARADAKLRKDRLNLLEKKYDCYLRLKPFYKRDVIELKAEADYPVFEAFVKKHREFVVKPSNFAYGYGVHKASIDDYKDMNDAFTCILSEGNSIQSRHPSRGNSLVLEELIIQSKELAALHPSSVNAIRATAVIDKNGKLVILHPWIKCGVNGTFVASAAVNGFDAEIDPESGVVITDGFSENGKVYKVHPDSGITIKGFQIPRWDELKTFVAELMKQLPEYRYIGWDLVLTDAGWVVMEGNYAGEFTWQLIRQCGGRAEFEELIGWKMDADFWWQIRPFPVSEK